MVSNNNNFVFDMSRDDTIGIPDRGDLRIHYSVLSTMYIFPVDVSLLTVVHEGDRAVLAALSDLFQQNLRIRPRQGQTRDRRDIRAIRASAVLVGRVSGSSGVAGVE